MPVFGFSSKEKLTTVHERLQEVMHYVIRAVDFTVIQGYRSPEEQLKYYEAGKSKVKFGKHNYNPSLAIDIAPYPVNWGESGSSKEREAALKRFYFLAGAVKIAAEISRVTIRWGGDWDSDFDFSDQTFNDLVHFEMVE